MYIRNITQADLQKVYANKIERFQACIDARGNHFQHLLEVHSDFPNALYNTAFVREETLQFTKNKEIMEETAFSKIRKKETLIIKILKICSRGRI